VGGRVEGWGEEGQWQTRHALSHQASRRFLLRHQQKLDCRWVRFPKASGQVDWDALDSTDTTQEHEDFSIQTRDLTLIHKQTNE
jgi:hypothetical protein